MPAHNLLHRSAIALTPGSFGIKRSNSSRSRVLRSPAAAVLESAEGVHLAGRSASARENARMISHRVLYALLLPLATAAAAPTPKPAPTRAAALFPAFTATGTMSVNGTSGKGKSGALQMDVRVAHRDAFTRVDILKVAVTTQDPHANSAMPAMLPKGVVSALVNTANGTLTMWSSTGKYYYQMKLGSPGEHPKSHPPKSAARPRSPFSDISAMLRATTQYDKFSSTTELVGDQLVNGHVSHVYHLTTIMQKHTDKTPQQIVANVAFADDLSGVPVHTDMTFTGTATAAMKMDLSAISLATPIASLFAPPVGYKRTDRFIMSIMGSAMPMPMPHPAPTKTP